MIMYVEILTITSLLATMQKTPETEIAKRSFKYMGAISYNDLSLNRRACEKGQNFRNLFNDYVL